MILTKPQEEQFISSFDGRPSDRLTDKKWQQEFNLRKASVEPYDKSMKKFSIAKFRESNNKPYHGQTNYQTYCSYMNGVLESIRMGHTDFCYYIYQILDLLKFHKNELRTKYFEEDRYWAVWLER